MRTAEAIGAGFKVAVLLGDGGTHFFKALDVEVDGAAADGAPTGHGDARHSSSGDERAKHERAGAHGFDNLVAGHGIGEGAATDGDAIVGAALTRSNFGAHGGKQFALGFNVADLGNVLERDLVLSEDGGGHAGEIRVLGSGNTDSAHEGIAAANYKFIHRTKNSVEWAGDYCLRMRKRRLASLCVDAGCHISIEKNPWRHTSSL